MIFFIRCVIYVSNLTGENLRIFYHSGSHLTNSVTHVTFRANDTQRKYISSRMAYIFLQRSLKTGKCKNEDMEKACEGRGYTD